VRIGVVLVLMVSVISGWYDGFATREARPLLIASLALSAVATIGLILVSYQLPRRH
jgi:hypothetical protein